FLQSEIGAQVLGALMATSPAGGLAKDKSESLRPSDPEETPEIGCSCRGDFFRRQVSHIRQSFRYFGDIGGLVALAAKRLWSEERSVSFDQDAVERHLLGNVTDVLRLGIGGIAREGDEEPYVETALGVFEGAGEAVQDTAKACGPPMLL